MAKQKFQPENPFQSSNGSSAERSVTDLDNSIFGSRPATSLAGEFGERLKNIDIFEITPDVSQPRRSIPSQIRLDWDGNPHGLADLFAIWISAIEEEKKGKFDLLTYLESQESDRTQLSATSEDTSFFNASDDAYAPGPLESSFMAIVELATSIRREGLTNPITVYTQPNGSYRLETGERRWLSYHLLHSFFPHEQDTWRRIAAREFEALDVWRQATENNARENLNPIGKARQLAVLMIDLLIQTDAIIKPFSAFESEREYYAQILGKPVPYGKGEQLLNAMGVSSRSALSRYRSFLELPDLIWQEADDISLSEEKLQKLAKIARKSNDEAIQAFYQMTENVLGQNTLHPEATDDVVPEIHYPVGTKRYFAEFSRLVRNAGKGKEQENAAALEELGNLRRWAIEQERRIKGYME